MASSKISQLLCLDLSSENSFHSRLLQVKIMQWSFLLEGMHFWPSPSSPLSRNSKTILGFQQLTGSQAEEAVLDCIGNALLIPSKDRQ